MPINTQINHEECLVRAGWMSFDVMTIGDPDAPLFSPCCEHGYRAVWDKSRILSWRLPHIPNTADEGRIEPPGSWQSRAGGQLYETWWNWHDERGGDEDEFFTGAQLNNRNSSWVLVAGVTPGTGSFSYWTGNQSNVHRFNEGAPTGAQAKWWTTTQTDLSSIAEEASLAGGHTLAGLTGWRADNVNTTDGLGTGASLPGAASVFEFSESSSYQRAGPAENFDVFWVLYGPREYMGITACQDPISDSSTYGTGDLHPLHGTGPNWSALQAPLPSILDPIQNGPASEGGLAPRLILYDGDVFGARATAPIDPATGDILDDVTIVDPGVTVVSTGADTEIAAPLVGINMPDHYQGFEATATVSTHPPTIQAAFPHLFKKKDELIAACGDGYIDPIAQTFMINELSYPDGIFLESVDVCFQSKPTTTFQGVYLEIRETLNGIPSAETAIVTKRMSIGAVKVADGQTIIPDFNDDASYTKCKFDYPIYLEGGTEYAIVIRSNSSEYKCWIADTEGTAVVNADSISRVDDTGNPNVVSTYGKQYGGVFFRSSNGRTWSENQNQDLMFRLNKCVFGGAATTRTSPKTGKVELRSGGSQSSALEYDRIKLMMNSILIPNDTTTKITGTLHTTSSATGTMSAVSGPQGKIYGQTEEAVTRDLSERMIIEAGKSTYTPSIKTVFELETKSPDVSPVIHTRACWANPIKNIINGGELTADDIQLVSDTGTGYNGSEIFTVSGGESTSDATFTVTTTGGIPTGVVIGSGGSGFHTSKNISISQAGGTGSGQEVSVLSEEGQGGGNAKARYVTRPINLASGMTARALKTFLTVHKPIGSSIYVYYKALAEEDSEDITRKKWKLMTQTTPDVGHFSGLVSGVGNKFKEYEFDSEETISYTNTDGSTYDNFKTFAIKIVMLADNKAKVPVIKNHRSIAVF